MLDEKPIRIIKLAYNFNYNMISIINYKDILSCIGSRSFHYYNILDSLHINWVFFVCFIGMLSNYLSNINTDNILGNVFYLKDKVKNIFKVSNIPLVRNFIVFTGRVAQSYGGAGGGGGDDNRRGRKSKKDFKTPEYDKMYREYRIKLATMTRTLDTLTSIVTSFELFLVENRITIERNAYGHRILNMPDDISYEEITALNIRITRFDEAMDTYSNTYADDASETMELSNQLNNRGGSLTAVDTYLTRFARLTYRISAIAHYNIPD